ncbi:hypothetical protein CMV_017210 [Castanea mollissima]|uniref:Uncharacterized protein n=1 Tax=Castanea mollissima TaxID=60419 RepID=A0A8J4QY79_9ROSI|nr:hypothetical protein CMV_017210 [Castanea mollissima]
MAEVMNMPHDSVDRSSKPSTSAGATASAATEDDASAPPPPPPPPLPHPPTRGRRERDSRDRRDDRDFDRPPNHRRDYYDRNMSPRDRDRDYKRRRSPSPIPPPYRDRDRRYSPHPPPPRRSPPPFKRSRRGSPRGGYGPDDRFGHDYLGGYERGMGGRPGYADEKSHGRFMNRSTGPHQNGPSDMASNRGGFPDSSNTGSTQSEDCQLELNQKIQNILKQLRRCSCIRLPFLESTWPVGLRRIMVRSKVLHIENIGDRHMGR